MAERTLLVLALAIPLLTGCASAAPRGIAAQETSSSLSSSSSPSESPAGDGSVQDPAVLPSAPPAAAGCTATIGGERLRRAAVRRTVDAGLGRWLQVVSIDPMLARGHFKGWIIRSLPADARCYAGLDLRAGDVVTRVNGRSIERPEQALEVWVALPAAPELVVDFLRDGRARTVRLGIVDQ